MKSQNREKFEVLLRQLNLSDDRVAQVADEIRQGDALLNRHLYPACPDGVLDRVEMAIDQRYRHLFWLRVGKVAAMVAIVFGLMMGVMSFERDPEIADRDITKFLKSTDQEDMTGYLADEEILWKLAYSQEESEQQIDNMALGEVLMFWETPEPVNDDPVGQGSVAVWQNAIIG
ncbi:MAG: hypothetical protein K9M57_05225 [Phycisphaerae bacterium]|nr:hypothetical protein [Phycisphaerae bacterium]